MKFGTIKTCWFRHQNLHMEIQYFSSLPMLSFPFHKLCMILHDSKWHSVIICISGIYTNGGCLYVSLIVRVIFPEKEKIQIKVKRLSHKKTCFVWVYLLILLWGVNNVCFCRSKYHFMTIGADTSLGIMYWITYIFPSKIYCIIDKGYYKSYPFELVMSIILP